MQAAQAGCFMNKICQYIIVTTLAFSIAGISFGQAVLSGKIKDQEQNLSSVSVELLADDSVSMKTTISGNDGEFAFNNITPGFYRITCSAVGHSKFLSKQIKIDTGKTILPDILLEKEAAGLKEVIVKAKKPLYEQQPDRLVINVQGSINSSGNTVLEILQKSPGISVDKQSNNISMNGKSGARVMMNGKLMQVPMDVVVQMLEGMSSSNVERIELITNPPSKYDAEGNAGIIHIVMKENTGAGTNGTLGLIYGYHWAETPGANFTINHRGKRLACFVDYSFLRNHNLHTQEMNRRTINNNFVQILDDYSHRENVTTQQNLNAGIEWRFSDNTLVNASFTAYRRDWNLDAVTNDINRAAADSTINTTSKVHESNIWQSATAGIGLQTKINSKSEATFNFDYLYYNNDNPSSYDNKINYEQQNKNAFSKIDLSKSTPIKFFVAKADYIYNLSSSLTWEAGAKGVTSNLDNKVLVRRFENNVWSNDSAFTSSSALNEKLAAVYTSVKWQAGKQLLINAGLRYEYTHTSIGTPDQKNLIDRKYGYLFPSFLIKRDLSKNQDIEFSYSRRITRPTYNDIAPFVFFWGPNAFSSGNTSLFPALSDAVKLGYHLRQWIVSMQLTHSKNEICFLQPEADKQTGNLIYRSQNLRYLNTIGITNTLSLSITHWWELQTTLTGQYQAARTSHLANNTTISQYSFNGNVVNVLKLPGAVSAEISALYQSRVLVGVSEYLPVWSLNAGFQRKFGEKITLRLAMDDIFNTNYWKIRTRLPQENLDNYFQYNFHNQFVRMTLTWKFGNNKLNSVKVKTGADEERGRVNN